MAAGTGGAVLEEGKRWTEGRWARCEPAQPLTIKDGAGHGELAGLDRVASCIYLPPGRSAVLTVAPLPPQ